MNNPYAPRPFQTRSFLPPNVVPEGPELPNRSATSLSRLTGPVQSLYSGPFMNRSPHVAVVGATGAVGIEMIKTLEKRNFPVSTLTLLASARSVGKTLTYKKSQVTVKELTKDAFRGIDIALFSAGGSISKEFAPLAAKAGCVVVDNSSAFRMDETVPLVVPEINASDVSWHKGIIANPNCTTAITLMALYPLHQAFGGSGFLRRATKLSLVRAPRPSKSCAGRLARSFGSTRDARSLSSSNCFQRPPQVDSFLPSGYTKEEMKMQNEGRKIMHHPGFLASVTCVRVPFIASHSVAVSAEFQKPVTVESAREVLKKAPGLDIVDTPEKSEYPLPLYTAEKDNCQVGRLRMDCAMENGLCFWVSGDQLLKGAALNAVQIAEELIK